ncbi:MAG TPA: hypothetical protein VFU31_13885 [Candidatus Binatia bacterium]|nr:hypothetical protein [Candidatus Binatia bacterium]
MKIARFLLPCLFLSGYVAAQPAPQTKSSELKDATPSPAFQERDFWHFKVTARLTPGVSHSRALEDGIYVLRYAGGKIQVRRLIDGDEQPAGRRPVLLALLGLSEAEAYQTLKFPLSVGQTWRYTYEADGPRKIRTRNVEVRVAGIEQISTPAGVFQAFRVEKWENWSSGGPKWGVKVHNVPTVYFYSPETKSIVKYTLEDESGRMTDIELIKFGTSRSDQG